MNVLFLNHPESDYGGAMLWNGLCETLGAEHVYDWPLKRSYHGETHNYTLPSGDPGCTCPSPWVPAWPYAYESEDVECINDLISSKFFDFVVVESLRADALYAFDFFSGLIHSANLPVVVHDGEDFSRVPWNRLNEIKPRVFLKRELIDDGSLRSPSPDSEENGIRIVGFPFSAASLAIDEIAPEDVGDEPYLVTFSAGATYPLRQAIADALRDRYGDKKVYIAISPDSSRSGSESNALLPWWNYIARMKSSLVGVSVRGFGWDSVRFWETALSTTLVTDKRPILFTNQYQHGHNAYVYEETPENCIRVVDEALSDIDRLGEIRERCIAHTRTYHTNEARAKTLLSIMESYC